MEELYWITRLDGILLIFFVLIIVSIVFIVIATAEYLITSSDSYYDKETELNKWKSVNKIFIPILIVSTLAGVFIPSTKDAYMIYGVGGTIDYLRSDSTAVELPSKSIEALNHWIESLNNSD